MTSSSVSSSTSYPVSAISQQTVERRVIPIKGREITYFIKKALIPDAPIISIFHGYGYNDKPARFSDPNLNIICPIDSFGYEQKGSWYLGENGDYFWLNAFPTILKEIRNETGNGQLFCWGSSMGGYAALLHGYLNDAAGIYANVAQTRLYGSTYATNHMAHFNAIFNNRVEPFNSVIDIIDKKKNILYYLTYAGLATRNYNQEHCYPLIEKFQILRQPFFLELLPSDQHKSLYSVVVSLKRLFMLIDKYK